LLPHPAKAVACGRSAAAVRPQTAAPPPDTTVRSWPSATHRGALDRSSMLRLGTRRVRCKHAPHPPEKCYDCRILRMNAQRLAAVQFGRERQVAVVVLAVQLSGWRIRHQMQRMLLRGLRAQPFAQLKPCRMRWAVVIAEGGDSVRAQLDKAAGREQRSAAGSAANAASSGGACAGAGSTMWPPCQKVSKSGST